MRRLRITIYTRVSTEEQAERPENSLDNQAHRCRSSLVAAGAHDPADIEAAEIYREEGFSGKDTRRPEFQRLMRDIRAGRVDVLVFTELSRISRSVSDFLTFTRVLERHGVEFISLKEKFDTTTPHGQLIMVVLMALYEFERATTSLRTRLAMRDRAERGLYNGGAIPPGYRPDPERSGNLLVIEDEAIAVREAFRLYLETGSVAKTTKALDERGYCIEEWVSRRGRHHPARPFSWGVVSHLLQNPTYLALKEINRDNRHLTDEDNLELDEVDRYRLVDAVWEPIIDADTFEAAQTLLAENKARRSNTVARKDYDYVLQKIVRCGVCGTTLEGASSKKQTYHYYRHPAGMKTDECGRSGHPAEIIEAAVLDRLNRLADDGELLELIVERTNERIGSAVPAKAMELHAARARLDRLTVEQSNLMDHLRMAPAGSVPRSFWDKANDLEEKAEAAQVELRRMERELEDLKASQLDADDYREALRVFRDIYDRLDPLQRSNLLAYLLDRVEVTDTHITVALLGEVPEEATMEEVVGADGRYRQTRKWLPVACRM